MKLVLNLLATFGAMVALLLFVGFLGGIGSVELGIWALVLVVLLVVVGLRSRRQTGGS